jgi:hypothetical protein
VQFPVDRRAGRFDIGDVEELPVSIIAQICAATRAVGWDRGFETGSLQRRVQCELDWRNAGPRAIQYSSFFSMRALSTRYAKAPGGLI